MKLNSPAQLKTTLLAHCRQPGKIAILTHKNPDGDGLAAALALQDILLKSGFANDIVLEEPAANELDFLQVKDKVIVFQSDMEYKILILVDCHEPERTGKCAVLAEKASVLIAIDHHEPQELNNHWYYYIKPDQVSAGAIIFTTFRSEIASMPPVRRRYVADCLYTTILNDTDGFMNSNTDAEVFRICAQLTEMGVIPHLLMEAFLLNNSPAKLRFIGEALSSIETYHDDTILFLHTTLDQLAANGLSQEDTSKITRWVKGSTGVKAFIYAREISPDNYRLSLRSAAINCNAICAKFGGGGHISASGCSIQLPFADMKKTIIDEVKKQLNG
ncbi:MAG: DHH family phosphoesterase [Candidatus Cloacimonetes bacterium]|nr:DHH family phosphoesterase [Candidatus Cloacimonadota bacterium]